MTELGIASAATWEEVVETDTLFTDAANGVWVTISGLVKPVLFVRVRSILGVPGESGDVFAFDEGTDTALQFFYDIIRTRYVFQETALNAASEK